MPLQWKHRVLTTGPQGSPLNVCVCVCELGVRCWGLPCLLGLVLGWSRSRAHCTQRHMCPFPRPGAALGPLLAGLISPSGWSNVFYMLMFADACALLVSRLAFPPQLSQVSLWLSQSNTGDTFLRTPATPGGLWAGDVSLSVPGPGLFLPPVLMHPE